jgi:hypothetical protein
MTTKVARRGLYGVAETIAMRVRALPIVYS